MSELPELNVDLEVRCILHVACYANVNSMLIKPRYCSPQPASIFLASNLSDSIRINKHLRCNSQHLNLASLQSTFETQAKIFN